MRGGSAETTETIKARGTILSICGVALRPAASAALGRASNSQILKFKFIKMSQNNFYENEYVYNFILQKKIKKRFINVEKRW